jgi:transcriptional repressor NrdR
MKCPFCNYQEDKVIDSRPTEEGSAIRRRRECLKCKKRFTTYEKVESIPLMVIKKDGSREIFNKNKVMGGLLKACEKRPISLENLESVIEEIESMIFNAPKRELPTDKIGNLVMDRLREFDEVAYVRFASVYKQFKDIETFMEELNKLKSGT